MPCPHKLSNRGKQHRQSRAYRVHAQVEDCVKLGLPQHACGWSGGRYIFQDWLVGTERPLTEDQASRLAGLFGIHPDD